MSAQERNPAAAITAQERNPAQVRTMFERITPRYDLLNHLLSFQVDRWWRRRVARRFAAILSRPGARVLDLCCGTGDLALALAARAHPQATILGADFCHPMLVRAREKALPAVAEADALGLPFADASFDLITIAFGFRNLADYPAGLREMLRVLKPGGEVGILEFSEATGPLRPAYNLYFRHLLPRIGGAISGDATAYRYLTRTVSAFPGPQQLAAMMTAAGFGKVTFERLTGGIACLHRGVKV